MQIRNDLLIFGGSILHKNKVSLVDLYLVSVIDTTGHLEHRILRVEVIEEGVVQNQSKVPRY